MKTIHFENREYNSLLKSYSLLRTRYKKVRIYIGKRKTNVISGYFLVTG